MPKNLFPLDNTKKFTDQKHVGHNRWHPDIPPNVTVKPGDVFRADCREWFDGAIKNDDSADDVRNAPLPGVHVLSGPFRVEGAEPGDLLIVDILEIDACDQEDEGPFSGMGWGYTGVFAKSNGGGFLTDRFPDAYKVIWDFTGDVATSRHIPECSYVGIHHPGLMGTAPSAELLAKWTKRETDLIATDPDRVPPLALPPLSDSAILGTLSGADFDRVAAEAARTAPPRENGGNQDIKNFTAGTRVFYPVFVPGANLSSGDLHSRRATVRSRSAARSRWAASWTSTSTSSRAAWRPTACPRTPSSCRACAIRTTRSGSRSPACPWTSTASSTTSTRSCRTSAPATTRSTTS
jgi:formamidase